MTVASTTNRESYTGNGTTTAFPFPNPYRASSDLIVTLRTIATGAESLQVEGVNYTVSGTPTSDAGGFASGTITFTVAPTAAQQVHIDRVVTRTQATDYVAGDGIPPSSIEGSLDKLTQIVQELDSRFERTLLQPRTAANRNLVLPEPRAADAQKVLSVNAGGTGYQLITPGGVSDGDKGDITVSNSGATWTIDAGAVTSTALADNAVTSAKILDGTIVNADINASAAIAHSKLANITAGQVLLGNASNVPTATALSGDVTVNSSGVTAIGSGVIVDADVNASAAIAYSKLASMTGGSVLLGNASNVPTVTALTGDVTVSNAGVTAIGAGVIVTADIANSQVTYAKIQNVSATDRVLGRSTAGAGVVEEIICTAAGRALIDDADSTAQRTTLGLGTIATQAANSIAITGGSATGLTSLSGAAIAGTTTIAAGHLADTTGFGSGGFFVGGANGAQYTGVRLFADGAANWAAFQTGKAENPTELIVYPNASQGYATTNSGTNSITRVSGTAFSSSWVGKTLYFLRKKFTVASVTPPNTLTVTEVGGGAVTFPGTETEAYNYFYTSGSGLCNVSGSTVTWVSGDPFVPLFLTDFEFTLNGTPRTVSTFNSPTQYTLSAAPGNGTNVPFTWRGNINDQLATMRVQAILGSDEENVNIKAFAGNNTFGRYYALTANYAGNGKYRPIYIGTGEFSDATFHHQIGCVPRNYAGATSDGYVSLGGVLGRDALRVFGPPTSAAYANRLEVFGGATTTAPNIRARGSDTNVTLGYDTQGTGAHVFTSGSFGRTNFKIYGSNGNDYLVTDASTGNPFLAVEGSSTNVALRLRAKGTGGVVLSEHADNNITVTGATGASAPVIAATSSGANIPLQLQSKGTGNIDFFANGALQYRINGSTGSVVNYAEFGGSATGFNPSLRGRGSDANVGMSYDSQGTGSHTFTSGTFGRTNFIIYGSAGNDYIAIDTATGAPAIATAGSSGNRDLRLIPAGTGRVRFGAYTATVSSIAGYIEIKDDGGTVRRLAVVS